MEDQAYEVDVTKEENENTIKIANDVVATIAGIATADIAGVAGMSGGLAGGIAQMLGKKQLTKGVKVEIEGNKAFIDIHIIVEFGAKIPEVAGAIQACVKDSVSNMTGLEVGAVNVHVQGVAFKEEPALEPTEPIEPAVIVEP